MQGEDKNIEAAQQALLKRASANSAAQLGKYNPSSEDAKGDARVYEKGYIY